MQDTEVMQEGQGSQRLDRKRDQGLGPLLLNRLDQVDALDSLQREAGQTGLRVFIEIMNFDEVGVMEPSQGREFLPQSRLFGRRGAREPRERGAALCEGTLWLGLFFAPPAAYSPIDPS